MNQKMEGGGFHGHHKLSNSTSDPELPVPDVEMKLSEANNVENQTPTPRDDNECTVREQDRFMPIANVIRIMRKTLPSHAKISDDAKGTIQECVSEYISFITSEANERCQLEQRKTITAEDVLFAMSKLGFDDYIEPLTLYLHRFREMDGERCAVKGEQFGKKTMDFGVQVFGPAFHLGYQHRFFGGGAAMDGSNAGSSQAAVAVVNHMASEINIECYDNQRLT